MISYPFIVLLYAFKGIFNPNLFLFVMHYLSIVHIVIMLENNLILKMHSSLTDMAILFYIHQTIDLIS
jgi:hypothetical protein